MTNINLYGTIGYTILQNPETKQQIIIFADRHDNLPHCTNSIKIADWFKEKMYSSKILLEEVPRNTVELEELWTDSEHTQDLKKLFLDNSTIINGLDIRPFLIPFSWELAQPTEPTHNITMRKYCWKINEFFTLSNFLKLELTKFNPEKLAGTKLGNHFLQLKNDFKKILENNSEFLNFSICTIKNINLEFLELINKLLDQIMEWYICAQIHQVNNKSIIVHAGLAHSDQVIELLTNYYQFELIENQGTNKLSQAFSHETNGCVGLSDNISRQFGGFK